MKKSLFSAVFALVYSVIPAIAQVGAPGNYEKYEFQPEAFSFPEYKTGDSDPHGNFVTSVPIFSLTAPSGISTSITFSYNSDIKYADPAGWIGLGWKWNPGTITRSVQGGFMTDPAILTSDYIAEAANLYKRAAPDFPSNLDKEIWDQYRDIYSISLPDGRSAKFILKKWNLPADAGYDEFQALGNESWIIRGYYKTEGPLGKLTQCKRFVLPNFNQSDPEGAVAYDYYAFLIVDENGVQYVFKEPTEEVSIGKNGAKALFYSTWRIAWIIDKSTAGFSDFTADQISPLHKAIRFNYEFNFRDFQEFPTGDPHDCVHELNAGALTHKKYLTSIETVNQRLVFNLCPDNDSDPTQYLVKWVTGNRTDPEALDLIKVERRRITDIRYEIKTGSAVDWQVSKVAELRFFMQDKRTYLDQIAFLAPGLDEIDDPWDFDYFGTDTPQSSFVFNTFYYHQKKDKPYSPFESYWDINGYYKDEASKYSNHQNPQRGQLIRIKYPNGKQDDLSYSLFKITIPDQYLLKGVLWTGYWGENEKNTGLYILNTNQYFGEESNPELPDDLIELAAIIGYTPEYFKNQLRKINYFYKPVISHIVSKDLASKNKEKAKHFYFTDPAFIGIPNELGFDKKETLKFTKTTELNKAMAIPINGILKRPARNSSIDDQVWFKTLNVVETGVPEVKTEWTFFGQDYYLILGPYGTQESVSSLFASNHNDIFFESMKTTSSDGYAVFSRRTFSNRINSIQYINTMPFDQPSGWKLGSFVVADTRPLSTVTQDWSSFPDWTTSGMRFTLFNNSVILGEAVFIGYNPEKNETEFKFTKTKPATQFYPEMASLNMLQSPAIESEGYLRISGKPNPLFVFPWPEIQNVFEGSAPPSGMKINFTGHKITTYRFFNSQGYLPCESWLARKEKPAKFLGWQTPEVQDNSDWLKVSEIIAYTPFAQPTEIVTPFVKEKIYFGNFANQLQNAPSVSNWYKPTGREILSLSDSVITAITAKYNNQLKLESVVHNNQHLSFTYDEAGRPLEVFRNGKKIKESEYNTHRQKGGPVFDNWTWLWSSVKQFNSADGWDWSGQAKYYDGFGEIQTVIGSRESSRISEPVFDSYWRPAGALVPFEVPQNELDYSFELSGGSSLKGETGEGLGLDYKLFSVTSPYMNSDNKDYRPQISFSNFPSLDTDSEANAIFGFFPFSYTRASVGGQYSESWKPGAGMRAKERQTINFNFVKNAFSYSVSSDENKKSFLLTKSDMGGRVLESGHVIPITDLSKMYSNLVLCHNSCYDNTTRQPVLFDDQDNPVLDVDPHYQGLTTGYIYYRVQPGEIQKLFIPNLLEGQHLQYVNFETGEVIREFWGPLKNFYTDIYVVPGMYSMEVYTALGLSNFVETGGIKGYVWSFNQASLDQKVSYQYDDFGRLKSVTHPDGTQTQYRYDYFGNILKKETPFHDAKLKSAGLAESDADANPDFEFLYDKYGRLRFSVDPNQSVAGKMTYFKYDYLSRPVEQGQIVSAGNWTAANADNGNWPQITGQNIHPTSVMSKAELDKPAASIVSLGQSHVVQTKIYYDISRTVHGYSLENGLGKPGYKIEYSPNPDGKFRAIRTYYSYTPEGWVKSVTEISDTVTKTEKFKEYDYQGKLKSWEASLSGKLLSKRRFWYDGLSRPVKISQIHAGRTDSVVWTYTYGTNENSVIQTNATGTFNQISIQDVRGWLREINSQSTGFSEELYYFGTGLPAGVQPNYNGNISFIRTVNRDVLDTNPVTCRDTLGFGFDYDNWNRLTGVKTFGVQNTRNDRYNSAYVYDGMGNMTSQVKKTWDQTTKVITELDNLVYQYAGTRLLNVIDKVKTARTDDYETTVNSVSGPSALINQSFAGFTEDFSQYPVAAGARPQSAIWDQTGFYSTDPASGVSIVSESGNLILKLTPQTSASSTTTSASMRTKAQTIIPGRIYTLAGKYKGVAVNSDEIPVQPNAYAGIEWLRQDFTRISVQYVLSTGRATVWTSFTGNLTAPADAVYARAIVMDNAATGTTVYFDNISLSEAGISFKYDNNGNLVQDLNRGISQLTYNSQNLPEKVTKTNGSVVYYGYNFSGQRIWKKVGPDTWVYVRDAAGAILAEYKNSSAAIEYVSLMTAGSETVGQSRLENGTWKRYYWVKDHLGNIRQTFRDDGTVATVVSTEDYYPFGATLKSTTTQLPAQDKFKYQGKERDQETGYDYFEARLYDSQLGRFLQVDPLWEKFKTSNAFVGMGDNPVRLVDPTGMAIDDFYSNSDGSLTVVQNGSKTHNFFVETKDESGEKDFEKVATLNENKDGLVEFPTEGSGFSRYPTNDAGGVDFAKVEVVGNGDHFLKPEVAASAFGAVHELKETGAIKSISFGDMSSSNGSDPWQSGSSHHKGHGHKGKRSGTDIDFRYVSKDGKSFQSANAFQNTNFSPEKNQSIFNVFRKFGFTANYQGTSGNLIGPKKVEGHNNHGHLGFSSLSAIIKIFK